MNYRQTPWRHDPLSKQFSHARFFGAAADLTITKDRKLAPVLNQQNTLRCTGYAAAANGWYIHGEEMSPDFQAAVIGNIQGRSVDINGGDPNAAMKSERDVGFLPATRQLYSIAISGVQGS